MPGQQGSIIAVTSNSKAINSSTQYQYYLKQYHLDRPIWQQFEEYFVNMLTWNFGTSFQTNKPVISDMIAGGRLMNTLILLGSSTILSIIIGVVGGIIVSSRRGSGIDRASVTTSLTTYSLPTFWMGIAFIFIFVLSLHWLPVPQGSYPAQWGVPGFGPKNIFEVIVGRFQYLFLPMLVLTLFSYGTFLLLTRATMLETLSEDYIVTARAKGLSERSVLFRHAFKNASLPIVTASALSFGAILGGAIITEHVFSWPGLGTWLFDSIGYKDFPVMQAMFFILALSVIIANFISDLVYGIIDPRIKYD